MAIEAGRTLLHYRLTEKIGEGGMGVVWRAVDTNLDRDVAIKVLPDSFSREPERLTRFEREAKLLASLNHPNIATVYGLHQAESVNFLAMELVEGEDLAARLERGPVPLTDAIDIATQIAHGVGAAHASGVIHRDLKPANVRIATGGRVKVLDFGLAKSLEARSGAGSADPALSPTMTSAGTQPGVIMGTAAYMSPEQARGGDVDRRADIWAFGCVLYEMLTGQRAFGGRTISDSLASVLRDEVALDALPPETPRAVRRLLTRCLRKDADLRLHDIADARLELEDDLDEPSTPEALTTREKAQRTPLAILAAIALVATLAAVALWFTRPEPRPAQVRRFTIDLDKYQGFFGGGFEFTPDRKRLVYVGRDPRILKSRSLDSLESVVIPGTENVTSPFFSPDGTWMGFASEDGKLRKMPVGGGPVVTLCEYDRIVFGADWSSDGTIYYSALEPVRNRAMLFRVSDSGGRPEPLFELAESDRDNDFFTPVLLPGERSILFTHASINQGLAPSAAEIRLLNLETMEQSTIIEGATYGIYAASGHVIGVGTGGVLVAVPFDAARGVTTGTPVTLEARVNLLGDIWPSIALSDDGTFVYSVGTEEGDRSLLWYDPDGTTTPVSNKTKRYSTAAIAPEGRRIAYGQRREDKVSLWVLDPDAGIDIPISPPEVSVRGFRWTPDGTHLVYAESLVESEGRARLVLRKADGAGEPTIIVSTRGDANPLGFSPDGKTLHYGMRSTETGVVEMWTVPVEGGTAERAAETIVGIVFSPDGRFMAYETNGEEGLEIYLRPAGQTRGGFLVSSDEGDGRRARWSTNGTEILYTSHDPERLMRVPIAPNGAPGTPELVRELDQEPGFQVTLSGIAPDGRLLVFRRPENDKQQVVVILDWFDELRRLAPN